MLPQSLSYLAYEADSLTYLITNVILVVFAFPAYFRARRAGFLLLGISAAGGAVGGAAMWVLRHYAGQNAYPMIECGLDLFDMLNATIGTIGIVLLIRDLLAMLPPPRP